MQRILISACLLGAKVRYDGQDRLCDDPRIARWQAEGRLVSFCPEVAGGFPTPRAPAEIEGEGGGQAVLSGQARVLEDTGRDVSDGFIAGAQAALQQALESGCTYALLTDGSPSCGSRFLYDGSFGGQRIDGQGVTAALLSEHGIRVFAEHQIAALEDRLQSSSDSAPREARA